MDTKTIIEKINQTDSIMLGDHVTVKITGIEEYQMEESRYNQKTHADHRDGSVGYSRIKRAFSRHRSCPSSTDIYLVPSNLSDPA